METLRLQSLCSVASLFLAAFFIHMAQSSATIKGPPTAEIRDQKQIVLLGTDVKLTCPISAHPPPLFVWSKDGEVISNYAWQRFRTNKKNLKITKAILDDTGIFVCKGTNGFGSQESRIDLIVIDPAQFPNLVEGAEPEVAPPVLTEETKSHPSANHIPVTESFKLVCEALAVPAPEVSWYKDQVAIQNGRPYLIERPIQGRSILTIDQVTRQDSGLYTCIARNSVGAAARNFTLDVIGDDGGDAGNAGETVVDFTSHPDHPDHPVLPSGPQNTTVEQGDKAVLECKVQSTTEPIIKWLKKLESREYDQVKDVIDLGSEKFREIPQQDEIQVLNDRDLTGRKEYLNKLVIPEATEADAGMYYCFVKNPVGYKFKNAYLTVVPKSAAPVGAMELSPIMILVICLALFVFFLLIGIVVCVLRKRQKEACQNSTISESPEVRENLMRNYQQTQPQGLYHQQLIPHQGQPQQTYIYQHLPHHQQQIINNNHRSTLGHMNIVVNKLDQPLPAPPSIPAPPPPPPPSSVHSSLQHHNLYNGRHPNSCRPSNTDNSSSQHSGGNYAIQQNQYEVPHLVRYGQVYNEYPYNRSQMIQHVHY